MKWLKRILGFKDENDESFLPEDPKKCAFWKDLAQEQGISFKALREHWQKELKEIRERQTPVAYAGILKK